MGKITKTSFSRDLRDNEFFTMCKGLVAVFEDAEHSIECETFDEALSRFKFEVEIMDAIMPRERMHALTHNISQTAILRKEAVQGLVYVVKAATKSTDMKKRDAARNFMAWFSKYHHNLTSNVQDTVTRAIEQVSRDIAGDASLGAAIIAMGISTQMTEIVEINPEISSLRHDRVIDLAIRKEAYVENAAIREGVLEALKTLLFQVETQVKWQGKSVAGQLELAILEVLNRSRVILKIRKTKSANKRAADSDANKPSQPQNGKSVGVPLNGAANGSEGQDDDKEPQQLPDNNGGVDSNEPVVQNLPASTDEKGMTEKAV